jgi:hypothetical protein
MSDLASLGTASTSETGHGAPLVTFGYDTEAEAKEARELVVEALQNAAFVG